MCLRVAWEDYIVREIRMSADEALHELVPIYPGFHTGQSTGMRRSRRFHGIPNDVRQSRLYCKGGGQGFRARPLTSSVSRGSAGRKIGRTCT